MPSIIMSGNSCGCCECMSFLSNQRKHSTLLVSFLLLSLSHAFPALSQSLSVSFSVKTLEEEQCFDKLWHQVHQMKQSKPGGRFCGPKRDQQLPPASIFLLMLPLPHFFTSLTLFMLYICSPLLSVKPSLTKNVRELHTTQYTKLHNTRLWTPGSLIQIVLKEILLLHLQHKHQ